MRVPGKFTCEPYLSKTMGRFLNIGVKKDQASKRNDTISSKRFSYFLEKKNPIRRPLNAQKLHRNKLF